MVEKKSNKKPVGFRFSKTSLKKLISIANSWNVTKTRALELMIRENHGKAR